MKREKLKLSTILSYALATGSGYQIMGSLVGAYLMIFLTDTFGVPAGAVGVITVVASVWDAINDPMMGTIADRTKSRWGKYRPYFLFIPAILTVVVVLLFASPNIGTHGKIIWTAVFYILYGMLRTAIEIPSGALINAVTDEPSERSKMINAYTMVMGICTTIATSFGLALVSLFGGDNTAKGYMIVVGLAGVIMTITCWMCFATTKETCVQHNEQKPLLEEIKNLFHVKGLLSVIAVWLAAYTAYNIMMSSSVYYIMYCLCRPDLISVYMLDVSLIGLLGIVIIVPLFMKLFHKTQKAFEISQVAVIICDILIVIFHGNMAVLFICSGVASMFATASMPFSAMMMTEMTDLVLIDSGRVVNGTMAALKGFSNKAGIAISSAIVSFTLAATGYIANAIGQEPQAVITGITVARFVVPVICGIVIILALVKYPITDEIRQKVRAVYEKQHTENK